MLTDSEVEKLHQEGLEILDKAKFYMNSTDFMDRGNHNDVLIESLECPGISIPCYRFTTYSDKSIDDLITNPCNLNEKIVKADDDSVRCWEILAQNTDGTCKIVHMINNMPWPLWARELVMAQIVVKEQDASWHISWSISDSRRPENPKETVRAIVHFAVYGFLKPTSLLSGAIPESDEIRTGADKKSKMCRVALLDPLGNIPAWLVDLVAKKQTRPLTKWR